MNGVMMPSVSAGSSQRDASVMCTPHVIVPSGAAAAGAARPSRSRPVRSEARNRVIGRAPPEEHASPDTSLRVEALAVKVIYPVSPATVEVVIDYGDTQEPIA